MQLDLKRVIEAVGKEKNVEKELLIEALTEAILTAARKFYGECLFEAKYNEEIEEVELWRYKVVTTDEEFQDELKEVPFSQATKMDTTLRVGDEIGEALPTEQLGRIAAQAAKQVIVQKMQEAEKDKIINDFKDRKGQLLTGFVRRFDKSDVIVDLGSCEGILPSREQIPTEKFKLKDKVTCLLLDVRRSTRGPQLVLSRAHPEVLIRLFEQEVSEIAEGIVIVQSAARDPGSRSKIAVYSNEPSVDPVGACVGVKGIRVQAIVQELRGEKIDIIPYDRDPARFVCNALAPADVSKVVVNERLRTMEVVVPDDNLSLAIGKRGQNVRLAAQLCGWKVDIRSESKMRELVQEHKAVLARIPSLGEMRAEILVNEGYKDPADIARMDTKSLSKLLRLEEEEAELVLAGALNLAEELERNKSVLDEVSDLTAVLDDEYGVSTEDFAEKELESIVARSKAQALLDPETIAADSAPMESRRYWMKLRGVGEQTASILHAAGFKTFADIAALSLEEVAHRTGLPLKLSGKLHVETSKIVADASPKPSLSEQSPGAEQTTL
jgi:N utilization substance protein A